MEQASEKAKLREASSSLITHHHIPLSNKVWLREDRRAPVHVSTRLTHPTCYKKPLGMSVVSLNRAYVQIATLLWNVHK
jgi:hypothetical protein